MPSRRFGKRMPRWARMNRQSPCVHQPRQKTCPDSSFAGQQDTYLNVRGDAALLDAIRRCWASLWTARAIGYRMKMGIDQRSVAMGVVVQLMVPADVSGILFTANPATGDRSELVVNASFGLGEAVVGGVVTPDTYVLDRNSLETKETRIGGKEQMIVSAGDQGTLTQQVPEEQRSQPSLSPTMLRELASLSLEVESTVRWSTARHRVGSVGRQSLAAAVATDHQLASAATVRRHLGSAI